MADAALDRPGGVDVAILTDPEGSVLRRAILDQLAGELPVAILTDLRGSVLLGSPSACVETAEHAAVAALAPACTDRGQGLGRLALRRVVVAGAEVQIDPATS